MKKIFIAMAAIFTMLLSVASPIMVKPIKANAISDNALTNLRNYAGTSNYHYLWYDLHWEQKYYNNTGGPDDMSLVIFVNDNGMSAINGDFQSWTADLTNNGIKVYNVRGNNYTLIQNYGYTEVSYSNGHFSWVGSSAEPYFKRAHSYSDIYTVTDCDTDIDEFQNNSLNVLVDFSPNLENNVFRAPLPDNGVTDYSKYFCMDITNNSRFGIQYFFALQEFPTDRTNINAYAPRPESGFCNALYSGQVYANEEWIYVHPFSANGIVKVLKPSQWHYIAAGESIHQDFSWSQFNLEKGKQYQAVVFAVKNDIGCASALNNYYNYAFNNDSDIAPFVIDFSEAECVYYSQFSIMNPVGYDPTDNKFGNYISSGDKSDAALYETKAYEDPTSGQLVIADKKTSGQDFETVVGAPTSGGSHGGGGYYTGSSYSGSSYNSYGGSFSSLNNYFSSFFAFISAVLNCFPSPYVVIITAGLSGLVVLGIIKVAIK